MANRKIKTHSACRATSDIQPPRNRCRTCSSLASFSAFGKGKTSGAPSATATTPARRECPADVEELGRSAWTVLHTMAATYPTTAKPAEQTQMSQFLSLFSHLYPCWVCADDFREWMADDKNKPRLGGRSEFGHWMCDAHNEVNRKLGKKEFDCRKWEERWKDGWKDGSCD